MPLRRFTSTSAEQCERVLHVAFVISKKCKKLLVREEIAEAFFSVTQTEKKAGVSVMVLSTWLCNQINTIETIYIFSCSVIIFNPEIN